MSTTELDTAKTENPTKLQQWRRPYYDVFESADAFDLKVSLPGVERDGVDISVKGESLTITATKSSEGTEKWRPLRQELPQGDFRLKLRLNVLINADKIEARVENGILNLSLPKADESRTRKIEIS